MLCLCLEDSLKKLEVETFSQAIALPNDVVKKLEELTPSTYSLRWSGLSVSLVDVLQSNWTNFLAGKGGYCRLGCYLNSRFRTLVNGSY